MEQITMREDGLQRVKRVTLANQEGFMRTMAQTRERRVQSDAGHLFVVSQLLNVRRACFNLMGRTINKALV